MHSVSQHWQSCFILLFSSYENSTSKCPNRVLCLCTCRFLCVCLSHHITVLSAVSLAVLLCLWVNVHPGAVNLKLGHMEHSCRAFSTHCNDAEGQQSYVEVSALRSSCQGDQCQWNTRQTHFYSQLKHSWPLGSLRVSSVKLGGSLNTAYKNIFFSEVSL